MDQLKIIKEDVIQLLMNQVRKKLDSILKD